MTSRPDSDLPLAANFDLKLLGSFALARDGQPLSLPTRKIESLLAYLVMFPQPHAREKLAALLWGDVPDEQARISLRYALAMLRKTLGNDLMVSDRETVQLNPEFPLNVDATNFMQVADREPAIERIRSLVTLYRGELMADYYDDWIEPERERLRQLYLDALLYLAQQYRSSSEYARATETARRLLESDPANERAHQHLMFCFVAQGERHNALAQYALCVTALREHLGAKPSPETTALSEWIKQARSGSPSLAARITNLPISLTSFIGREKEMSEVKRLLLHDEQRFAQGRLGTNDEFDPYLSLSSVRLVTLVGAGGSGKTRLAVQVATDLIDAYHDGVWWVELAALTDGALVAQAVAKALGVRESAQQPITETLESFLREKQLLLVVDNCEHLLDACAHLARMLLGGCANLQILATSREPLGFIGETVCALATLRFPDPNTLSVAASLMEYEAIRLFVERARAVDSEFVLRAENAPAVAKICARLDGIPLALELAAARTYEMLVEEIAARLDDRFNFLTRGNRGALPRQQTLRALIAWSYDLLSEQEQILFRRLAVFASSFTADVAARVCELGEAEVNTGLAHLVGKSLVTVERVDGETRYRLLETIRDFGRERLRAAAEEQRVRAAHFGFVSDLAEHVERESFGKDVQGRLNLLEKSYEDVRSALHWTDANTMPEALLQLVGAMRGYWIMRGHWNEGRQWLERALELNRESAAQLGADPALRRLYARAVWSAGDLIWRQSDYPQGQKLIEAGLLMFQELGDLAQCADLMHRLGGIAFEQGDFNHAHSLYQGALAIFRELNDAQGIADSLGYVALADFNRRDLAHAKQSYNASLELARELENPRTMAFALLGLGNIANEEKEYGAALSFYEETLEINRELGNKRGVASVYNNMGSVLLAQEDFAKAHTYLEKGLEIYYEVGTKRGLAYPITTLAQLAFAEGKFERAVELFGFADALLRKVNGRLDAFTQAENARLLQELGSRLESERFNLAWGRGQRRSMEEAVEFARETE